MLKIARTEHCCGGAGSVVADLASLGARAYCLGVIGDDCEGEILKTMLVEVGADAAGCDYETAVQLSNVAGGREMWSSWV